MMWDLIMIDLKKKKKIWLNLKEMNIQMHVL